MTDKTAKFLLLSLLLTVLAGCKITVIVAEGGHVDSIASGSCSAGENCVIDIETSGYSETFTAAAGPGYVFTKWNTGGGFFCADSTNTACTVTVPGGSLGEAIVGLFEQRGYIMPIFEQTEPILDSDGDGLYDIEDPFPNDPYLIPPGSIVAVDINGLVWGPVVEEGQGYIKVLVKFDGAPDPYTLHYNTVQMWVGENNYIFFEAADCDPDAGEVYVNSDFMTGDNDIHGPTLDSRYFIPDELAFEVKNPAVLSILDHGGNCTPNGTGLQWYTPMKVVGPLDIALPLHKEYR